MPKPRAVHLLYFIILCGLYLLSCQKELSYEGGVTPAPKDSVSNAQGALQDTLGNCRNIIINGTYLADTNLAASNFIIVTANITVAGKYKIFTDTVNGCWFIDTGTITNTGLQSFTLKGYGKPATTLFKTLNVHFSGSVCQFTIPAAAATYTFNAQAGSCPNFVVSGVYHLRATLGLADTVVVPITVITAGEYSIQTVTENGMTFSAKGVFSKTGNQTVTLTGSGTPAMKGTSAIPLSIAGTTCSFSVNLLIDTSMYWQFTAEGVTYSGIMDSAYGVLRDTGIFILNKTDRVFAVEIGGRDRNGDLDSSTFEVVLSRLNHFLTVGSYHTFEELGQGDFNGYFQYQISNSITDWFYSSSQDLNQFTITVSSCDPSSKLLQGTFSGNVYKLKSINDRTGPVVNITNGIFKTYLAY